MLTRSPRSKRYVASDGRSIATEIACALCLMIVLAASSACTKDGGPKYVGFVLDVSGPCALESGQRIQAGQRILAGATLHFQPHHSSADFVEIALGDGTKLSLHCSEPRACDSPIHLPTEVQTNNIMRTILDSVLPQGVVYETPISRGASREIVLQFSQGLVDFRPLLGDAPQGVYTLVIDRVGTKPAEPVHGEPLIVSLTWVAGGTALVKMPGLQPGLFEVTIPNLQMDNVWALIVPAEEYVHDKQALQDASDLAQHSGVTGRSLETFLRTYLASLATRPS
jgi:hypothetical protein